MNNSLLRTLFIVLLTVLSLEGQAASADLSKFIGLWQGVDTGDGSLNTLEIVRNGDGTVRLMVNDTYWERCGGGRGIGQGTGSPINRNTLQFDDYTITCFGSSGPSASASITVTLGRDGSLTRTAVPPHPSIVHYRISRK